MFGILLYIKINQPQHERLELKVMSVDYHVQLTKTRAKAIEIERKKTDQGFVNLFYLLQHQFITKWGSCIQVQFRHSNLLLPICNL